MPDVMSKADEAGTETSAKSQGGEQSTKRAGTRVFKKSTPNGKLTVYIGKRDFYDHIEHVDPIDGVVLVDPEHVKDRIVYCHVLAAFRYGREDLDVLGLTFRKDLFLARQQVYPAKSEDDQPLTRLQERLLKKLGKNSYPFKFQERQTVLNGITVKTKKKLPKGAPSSVTLQPAPGDTGKPCGVDYELKVYLSDTQDEKEYKRNSVRLAIRKITYAPPVPAPQPMIEAHKEFMMCPHPLFIEASLDKGMYYHGESISVNVHISNRSNKTVKRIKITVRQYADICLFSTAQYKCPIACLESEAPGFITLNSTKRFQAIEQNVNRTFDSLFYYHPEQGRPRDAVADRHAALHELKNDLYLFGSYNFTRDGFPVGSSGTLSKVYVVTPLLKNNKDKRGLALDGQLKHEDTCLASSTTTDPSIPKENLGIIVHYKVKIRLIVALGSDLSVELPFMLTHPKPPDDVSPSTSPSPMPRRLSDVRGGENEPPIDSDLITFDTSGPEKSPGNDDLIFEEFARMRVRGEHQGETNA